MTRCFLAEHDERQHPCEGRLDVHHLVKQQVVRRRFPFGAVHDEGRALWLPLRRGQVTRDEDKVVSTEQILNDDRNLVVCCRTHHSLAHAKRFYVPREALPAGVEAFAREFDLGFYLEREYGQEAS